MRRSRAGVLAVFCGAMLALGIPGTAWADHGQPWHWSRSNPTPTAVAQAYFVDHTGPNWPVFATVFKWDNRPNYYLPYYSSPGSCNSNNLHCIPVRAGNYGSTNWYGRTVYDVNLSTDHIVHDSMNIKFNEYFSLNANKRESLVCHEMGHGAGPLSEGTNTNSCMFGSDTSWPLNPSSHDFDIIVNKYDH